MHMRENLSLQYSNRVLDAITSQNLTFDTTKENAEGILLSGTQFQASQNTCVKLEIQIIIFENVFLVHVNKNKE